MHVHEQQQKNDWNHQTNINLRPQCLRFHILPLSSIFVFCLFSLNWRISTIYVFFLFPKNGKNVIAVYSEMVPPRVRTKTRNEGLTTLIFIVRMCNNPEKGL